MLIGMRAGKILAAIAERLVAAASQRANGGRMLTLWVLPPQLREAGDVCGIELTRVAIGA
jgi:hypothetical protein